MKNKRTLAILLLVFVLLMGGAYALYTQLGQTLAPNQLSVQTPPPQETDGGPEETPPALVAAPDFTVFDSDGNEVHLSDYVGKPIVLNFWASWCGPCQMEMPDFHETYLELGDEVQFLMVNMTYGSRETQESASAFIEDNGYTFPVFYDTEGDAAMTYGAYSLPTTYFIDADGYAVAQAKSAINAETLLIGIDLILPDAASESQPPES